MHDNHETKLSESYQGCEIHLMPEDNLNVEWCGQKELFARLEAAWLSLGDNDLPLCPVIVGPPGCGKTSMLAAMARHLRQPLYIFQCTMDTRPEDLLITPVLTTGKDTIRYQASSLVSAMRNGGICILDEANRMRDKAWASLAPLLDDRRYVESTIIGRKITAHKKFRIAATMNEDSSTYRLPEYIGSRLRPRLEVLPPDPETIKNIITRNLPAISEKIITITMNYLNRVKGSNNAVSLRQFVQLAAMTGKFCKADRQLSDVEILKIVEDFAVLILDHKESRPKQ